MRHQAAVCQWRRVHLTGTPGIGCRICVYWPSSRNWYSGQVAAFDNAEGLSKIQYDDGDVEWLHLAVECYMLQPAGGLPDGHSHQTSNTQCMIHAHHMHTGTPLKLNIIWVLVYPSSMQQFTALLGLSLPPLLPA